MREREVTGAASYRAGWDVGDIMDAWSMAHMRMVNHAAQLGLVINYATVQCRVIDAGGVGAGPGLTGTFQIQFSAWVGVPA